MDNSNYARMVLKSNRTIALAVDEGINAFQEGFKNSIKQISSGAERLTWYSSCFFESYQEECKDLKREDIRMGVCIREFFIRKDPIADLILMCVKYIFNFYDKKERIKILAMVYDLYESYKIYNHHPDASSNDESYLYDINDCADFLEVHTDSSESRKLLEKLSKMCELSLEELIKDPLLDTSNILNPAKITTDVVARKTTAYAFAKAAAESMSLTLTVRRRLNKNGAHIAFSLYYYGIVQKAAAAAEKLKMLNSAYYQILYNNNLEMFFFLIEPSLPPEIYHPTLFVNNEDVAVNFLKSLLK
ncbi:hypothetical protein [Enterobacter sp.]|uniref:hypothetical protein n=1 Tax=Enterobacter sp. TaxID=42895 RepID=UPI00296EEB9A|nr:hypothetical protein [Enterobacter sp.]